MPAADLRIHDNPLARTAMINGISVRNDVLFTNDKGEDNRSIQKRNEKALQKLLPALQHALLPAETVLYIARAQSPLTVLEQLTAGLGIDSLEIQHCMIPRSSAIFAG